MEKSQSYKETASYLLTHGHKHDTGNVWKHSTAPQQHDTLPSAHCLWNTWLCSSRPGFHFTRALHKVSSEANTKCAVNELIPPNPPDKVFSGTKGITQLNKPT